MNFRRCKSFIFLLISTHITYCSANTSKNKKGKNEFRISGGKNVDISQRPFQAVILRFNNAEKDKWSLCGGSIYNRRYIITAAHCLYGGNEDEAKSDVPDDQFVIFLGRVQNPDHFENELIEGEQKYNVVKQIAHEKYDKDMVLNVKHRAQSYDIALLELDRDINYTRTVKPIKIQTCPPKPNTAASVSGWGFVNKKVYLNSNDELIDAEKLQIAELKILSQDDCINKMVKTDYEKLVRPGVSLDSKDRFGTRCLHRDYLCAYAPDKDACYGDSGGPLVCGPKECPRLCGIVSHGEGCALNFPGFYVDVNKLKCWIRKHAGLQDI